MKLNSVVNLWPPFSEALHLAPTMPGPEFTLPPDRCHFVIPENLPHLTLPANRPHFTIYQEN